MKINICCSHGVLKIRRKKKKEKEDLEVLENLYIHKLQPNLNDYNSSFDLHIVK